MDVAAAVVGQTTTFRPGRGLRFAASNLFLLDDSCSLTFCGDSPNTR